MPCRWPSRFTRRATGTLRARLEAMIGNTLTEFGYSLASENAETLTRTKLKLLADSYTRYFDSKLWLKSETPAGHFLVTKNLSGL